LQLKDRGADFISSADEKGLGPFVVSVKGKPAEEAARPSVSGLAEKIGTTVAFAESYVLIISMDTYCGK